MLERLALSLACGFIGYTIAREYHRNEGREHFDALMDSLPWHAIEGIDDYLNGEPMLTQSVRDEE